MNIDWTSLNVVDFVILAILLISIITGLGRGLVSEVLSLLVLVVAFVFAVFFANDLAAYFTHAAAAKGATSESISYVAIGVSFGIIFLTVLVVGSIIKMLINMMLHVGGIGFINRVLGGGFGLVRGYLLDLVLIFLIQLSPLTSQPWWQQSQLVPHFQPQVVWLGAKVSPVLKDLRETFESKLKGEEAHPEPEVSQDAVQKTEQTEKTE